MKRWVIILAAISILIFGTYVFLSNGIPEIKEIKIQSYNHKNKTYEKERLVSDRDTINKFTRILNRAGHEAKTMYEMANHEDHLVTATYEGGRTDEFRVWESSGRYTHIIRAGEGDSFKIGGKGDRKKLLELIGG
ncbi:hypothetical protein LCM10_13000 [Rossellomorea aquimaris]|uniref:hypothetical protein n=1 Tax=Rossellomorea aquimaris TaxID=189382 RepID=UPI001CD5CAE4|nr:hypothetical protein [Rossellomorea aquimaris]MCA1055909.1 hypothetical protein [Rossellomorea aquimaris]